MVQKLIGIIGTIVTITVRLMMRPASNWRLKKLSLKSEIKDGVIRRKIVIYIL